MDCRMLGSIGFGLLSQNYDHISCSHCCENFANELEHCLFEFNCCLLSNQFLSSSPSINNYNHIDKQSVVILVQDHV